jgi:hypothetical protein
MMLKAGSGAGGGSFRHPQTFCSGETLLLTGVIRVAGEGKADGVVGDVGNAKDHEECDGTSVSLLRNLMEI